MKTNFLIIAAAFVVLTTSCKKEKDANAADSDKPAVIENFRVEMDVVVSKPDSFALYYTENNTIDFTEVMALWKAANGGNVEEKVVFDLPEEILPTDIRLDFGLNKSQESVVVKHVKMSYYGNVFEFKGSDFFNYFIKDANFKAETDPVSGTMTITKNGPEYKTPFFYPRQELIDALKKITTVAQ